MPNGHGGYPFLGSPILLAILFALTQAWDVPVPSTLNTARVAACIVMAAAAGWRLAYHLHMRAADAYSGQFLKEGEREAARKRYVTLAVVYALIAGAIGTAILRMRGLL
jgi:hypothetical protein